MYNSFDKLNFNIFKPYKFLEFDNSDSNFNAAFLSVSVIKTWNVDVKYFLNFNILKCFDLLNKNKMRNIFLKVFNNLFLWKEIEKMLNINILSISGNSLYNSRTNLGRSLLSVLLFEVYIHELDIFVFDLIRNFNFRRKIFNLDNNYKKNFLLFSLRKVLGFFFPIRLGINISKFISIKNIVSAKYKELNKCYLENILVYENFDKYFYYTRYLDSFLLGFVGNKCFVNFIQKKLLDFIRTNLHFEMKNINIFSSVEKCVIFLSYNIKLFKPNNKFSYIPIKKNRNFIHKSLSRLEYIFSKNSDLLYQRFGTEFCYNIDKFIKVNPLVFSSLKDKNFWIYLFQLEAIRSIQFEKLVLSFDRLPLVPSEFIFFTENSKSSNYLIYRFNLYNLKMQKVLHQVFQKIPFRIKSSVLPFDLVLNSYFLELKKKIFFMYNNYYFDIDKKSELSVKFLAYKRFYSSLGNLNFYPEDLEFLKTSFYNRIKQVKDRGPYFSPFLPMDFLVNKLRYLGYIHPVKFRPIGNSKYLHYSDDYIIKSFGLMAFSFLNWYKFCNDWKRLNLFVNLIRESCFLTLCRKHNKSKCWAYCVYTPDLVISSNLFSINSFFPTRNDIIDVRMNLSKNFSNTIDEKFFVNFD